MTHRPPYLPARLSDRGVYHFVLAALAIALLRPDALWGWGPAGHEIVARIAESRLTPKAKAAVADLLGSDKSIADVASWADQVRKDREETGPWHYVDIPYEMSGYDPQRDGKNGNNVIDKLQELANVLNDRRAQRNDRVEALKFVVHFMGDLHQPLHCAERNDDKGGNFRLVMFPGERKAVSLHRIWDSSILLRKMDREKTKAEDYASKLNAAIARDQERQWLASGDVVRWANESHKLAVDVVYAGIPTDGPPPTIDDDYFAKAEPVIDLQLSRAGVRLAAILNRIFQ